MATKAKRFGAFFRVPGADTFRVIILIHYDTSKSAALKFFRKQSRPWTKENHDFYSFDGMIEESELAGWEQRNPYMVAD